MGLKLLSRSRRLKIPQITSVICRRKEWACSNIRPCLISVRDLRGRVCHAMEAGASRNSLTEANMKVSTEFGLQRVAEACGVDLAHGWQSSL